MAAVQRRGVPQIDAFSGLTIVRPFTLSPATNSQKPSEYGLSPALDGRSENPMDCDPGKRGQGMRTPVQPHLPEHGRQTGASGSYTVTPTSSGHAPMPNSARSPRTLKSRSPARATGIGTSVSSPGWTSPPNSPGGSTTVSPALSRGPSTWWPSTTWSWLLAPE